MTALWAICGRQGVQNPMMGSFSQDWHLHTPYIKSSFVLVLCFQILQLEIRNRFILQIIFFQNQIMNPKLDFMLCMYTICKSCFLPGCHDFFCTPPEVVGILAYVYSCGHFFRKKTINQRKAHTSSRFGQVFRTAHTYLREFWPYFIRSTTWYS